MRPVFRALRPVLAWLLFSSALVPVSALGADTQDTAGKSVTLPSNEEKEAFVIEQFFRKEKFENDGTSFRQDTARVRIQSEAGLQRYGLLSFSYASGTGTFQIAYVRVRKPDGTMVETPLDAVQDMPADITRQAPFYSDLHEKHLAVKGLSVGDVLEFQVSEQTTKPLAPGQFWTQYGFTDDEIVRDEQLEISVPRDRVVKMKTATLQPAEREEAGYRIYSWRHSNLQRKTASNAKSEATERLWRQIRGRLPHPDVWMSSFSSWEEVGHWYEALQAERVKPGPEVSAKAAELTKGALTDDDKIRALYAFVSTQFRYIGVAFGIGRYQPHSSAEVLANQYGDCKDKHTLLASLLTSVGIPAYPALIGVSRDLDVDVPSPGQFDHVITVVPRPAGLVWLDTTTEVGPFQFLLSPLRDKHALVIWKEKPAALTITPANLPYPSRQTFHMSAKLNDSGTLEGNTDVTALGDSEFVLRASFRVVPVSQWKDLAQQISYRSGFAGEVSEVTASTPEKTGEPFHFAYKYTRKDFGDWPNHRILAPSPIMALLAPGDDDLLPKGPLWLGSPGEIQSDTEVEVPAGYHADPPAAVHVKKDFAEYDATYEFKQGRLISSRHLKTLLREVPEAERKAYIDFIKTISDDYGLFIALSTDSAPNVAKNARPSPASAPPFSALQNLPDSPNPEALRLENEARQAMSQHELQTALSSLYRATAADPKFTRAWISLGALLLSQKQLDAGLEAFHKAMDADPNEPAIPKMLGTGLLASAQYDAAIRVWQDYVKAYPDDVDGSLNLGNAFAGLHRYSEAGAAFESAAKAHGDRADVLANLGNFYLRAGEHEKAEGAFRKLADTQPDPRILNDVAYQMANANLALPLALDFATKAVQGVEQDSQKITLANLTMQDVRQIFNLMAFWDTMGWVEAQNSHLPEAQSYLSAAWKLAQDGVVGSHLCEIYDRMHKVQSAIQMCRMALFRMPMTVGLRLDESSNQSESLKKRLEHLHAPGDKSKGLGDDADLVIRERTFKLPRLVSGIENAEFFVLFSTDGKSKSFKVEDVKFVSGSSKLKMADKHLKGIDFGFPAPGSTPARFVRRGIMGCYPTSGCTFVLLDPSAVHSLE